MLFTRNMRDTKNITLLNVLIEAGGELEYIENRWWYEGKVYNSLVDLANYMMIPLVTTRYVLESYSNIGRK